MLNRAFGDCKLKNYEPQKSIINIENRDKYLKNQMMVYMMFEKIMMFMNYIKIK